METIQHISNSSSALSTDGRDILVLTQASMWIDRFIIVVVVFGLFGNVMTVLVVRRLRWSALTAYFTALALSDLTLLCLTAFRTWLIQTFSYDYFTLNRVVCKLCLWLLYVTGVLSPWVLVAMTVQRVMSVVWPHRVNGFCTRTKAVVFLASVAAFLCLLHSPLLYAIDLAYLENETVAFDCTFSHQEYEDFMQAYWSWVDLLLFSVLPSVILIGSNAILIKGLATSVKAARAALSAGSSDQLDNRQRKVSSVTVTLVVVSAAFLLLTLPMSVFLMLYQFINVEEEYMYYAFELFRALCNCLWTCNSAINFYVYCLTGSKFRAECFEMFRCFRPTKAIDKRVRNVSGMSQTEARENPDDADGF